METLLQPAKPGIARWFIVNIRLLIVIKVPSAELSFQHQPGLSSLYCYNRYR